ncbi:MAG: DUF3300 domain-containing protein [Nitrospirota bacterium]
MKPARMIIQVLILMIFTILVLPPGMPAQEYVVDTEQSSEFKKEELVQMLAPIALYPDSLITQMLMASTYPLEVVEAERWLRQNKDLKGDALNDALLEVTWDPSIKSLCHFPDVLFAMSDKLDQTRKLGDAFLSQEEDVMATIQELRQKAHDQGNLKTTKEQKVIIEREIIRVEPADPQVVYVPVYDPFYIYGPWWYPAYLPWYWYYPHTVAVTGGYIHFGSGFFLGIGISSWSWYDWHRHYIYIDVHKARRFHRFRERHDSDRYYWRHNPRHRRGVAYRNRKTSERFRPELPRLPKARPEMRGYPSGGFKREKTPARSPMERREGDMPRVKTQPEKSKRQMERRERDMPRVRTQPEKSRRQMERRERDMPRVRTQPERLRSPAGSRGGSVPQVKIQRKSDQKVQRRDTPFRGIGDGNFERKAGKRGGYSRQGDKEGSQEKGSRKSSRGRGSDKSGSRR